MTPTLRPFALACSLITAAGLAAAQAYPTRPITLVIAFPPGGGADAVARPIAEQLGKALGQPVVLDYRPGAGTTLASAHVAAAKPDGYTLYMASGGHYGADRVMYGDKVRYDGASFTPVARWTKSPLILAVNATQGLDSVPKVMASARMQAERVSCASSGNGVAPHLAAVLFENAVGARLLHVPFKGGAAAVGAVAAGDVHITFGTPGSVLPLAQAGKVTMLAVTSAERSTLFPELPALAEEGLKDFDYTFWFGLFGPRGLPPAVVDKLFEASNKALADTQVLVQLMKSGNQVALLKSPAEFAAWAKEDGARGQALMVRSGAKVE